MKKAVIFDLDGTLTNTLKSLWKSTNMALATAGLPPHEIDSYKYFAGNGAKELIRKSLIADGDTELVHFDSVMEAYNRIFESPERKGTASGSELQQTAAAYSRCGGGDLRKRHV